MHLMYNLSSTEETLKYILNCQGDEIVFGGCVGGLVVNWIPFSSCLNPDQTCCSDDSVCISFAGMLLTVCVTEISHVFPGRQ